MAEISSISGPGRQKMGCRFKKKHIHTDLTPLVDLGFLLISFFLFTTRLSEAAAMPLRLPDTAKNNQPATAGETQTLQLLLDDPSHIRWYDGTDSTKAATVGYNPLGLRKVILDKKQRVALALGSSQKTIILIKPSPLATFGNMITVLDEMKINQVNTYLLMDETAAPLPHLTGKVN